MNCPNCGAEVAMTEKIGEVEVLYCENCRKKSSVRSHGKIRDAELKIQRRSYMRRYIENDEIKTSRGVPAKKLSKAYK